MLTESFVASIAAPEKPLANAPHKDAGVFFHELQPQPTIRSTFKKSTTRQYGLAVSSTHVFAVQTDKAVVNVYNIGRGNQETFLPFKEKITSLALVSELDNAAILALGTEGGRLILCELCTGRQVSTPAAHLQALECMVVDSTQNFLLTGSPDSTIHVWSIPALMSFTSSSPSYDANRPSPYSPLHTLSNHRGGITAIETGHSMSSANITISASKDKTCIVWDYQQGQVLHYFLLAATPLCIALDPADRGFYVGHEDGTVQRVDFYKQAGVEHPIYDSNQKETPTRPSESDRWLALAEPSEILCLDVSYDGTTLVTGHRSGKIQQWDVGTGRSYGEMLADLNAPVTNLVMQRPQGLPKSSVTNSKLLTVVKPVFEGSATSMGSGDVPRDYTFRAQFKSALPLPRFSKTSKDGTGLTSEDDLMADFDEALSNSSFPQDLLDEGLQALSAPPDTSGGGDIAALKGWQSDPRRDVILAQEQVTEARKENKKYLDIIEDLSKEVLRMQNAEQARKRNKTMKRIRREKYAESQRKQAMGEAVNGDQEMQDEADGDSTSTDDMSGSN